MASIADNRKKRGRGRPRTGIGKPVGLRLYPELEQKIDAWASKQPDRPGRPEAIRRIIEQTLSGTTARRSANKTTARKASELAAREIERLADKSQPEPEQQRRKRRLIHGPKEFRDIRGDQPKTKVKRESCHRVQPQKTRP
jgi:hypothetical protein